MSFPSAFQRSGLRSSLPRLVQGGFTPVPRKIARTIQLVVSIGFATIGTGDGRRAERRLREVLRVSGVRSTDTGHEYQFAEAV